MRLEHATCGRRISSLLLLLLHLLLLLLLRVRVSRAASPAPFAKGPPQCLPLGEDLGPRDACGPHVRLRFCEAYAPARLLRPCEDGARLGALRALDEGARGAVARFRRLLERYDCENANSVSWTCRDCEEAYKAWVCAMFLPPLPEEGGRELKPCRFLCRRVEQRCPYFHPSVKDQYAGERVFKCIDPDIPDLEGHQANSSYGPPHRCYCPRHLSGGDEDEEPECRPPGRGSRSGGSTPRPPLLAWAAAALAWWRHRRRAR